MNRWIAGAGGAAALGLIGWAGYDYWQRSAPIAVASQPVPAEAGGAPAPSDAQSIDAAAPAPDNGGTPMRDRVVVIGLLNKRNGVSRELTMKPGGAVRVGDVIVRLRACERTAPWEQEQLTGAFVQLDVHGADRHWHRVFSGWLYKERPALNAVQDPVYDVWTKSCTMSLPETGPDTAVAPSDGAPATRSSRKKSPAPAADGDAATPADGATTPASADDKRDT